MNWFTSDPHYFHKHVIEYCNRPFASLDEMHAMLIANWNMFVSPDDAIYVIGDFSFGNAEQTKSIIKQLHGDKYLIVGNHDKGHSKTWWKNAGFIDAVDSMRLKLGAHEIELCHFPSGTSMVKTYDPIYDPSNPRWLLCGHVHNRWKIEKNIINVGVDVWNFLPVADFQISRIIGGW